MRQALKDAITDFLDEAGEATILQITEALDFPRESVQSMVGHLAKRGELMRRPVDGAHAMYSLADEPLSRMCAEQIVASAMAARIPLEIRWLKVVR